MNRKRNGLKIRCCVHGCTRLKEKDDERCLYHIRAKYGSWLNQPTSFLEAGLLDTNEEFEV